MAKGEAGKTNKLIDTQRQTEQARDYGLSDTFQKNLTDAQTRASDAYQQAGTGFQSFASGGGVPADLAGDVRGSIAGYNKFASGRDPSSQFYQNLMSTGGYTPEQLQNMQLQNTANVPQFYQNLMDEMQRQNTAQGGISPGFNASEAAAAREASRGGQEAALNSSISLADLVRQGKVTGAEGLSRNQLAGLGGATGAALSEGGLETGAKEFGVGGQAALRGQTPGEVNMYNSNALSAEQLGNTGVGQNLNTRVSNNPNVSVWDRVAQIGGALGGVAGAATGLGYKPFQAVGQAAGVTPS